MQTQAARTAAAMRGRARASSPIDRSGDCGCGCGGTCGGTARAVQSHAPIRTRQIIESGDMSIREIDVSPSPAAPEAQLRVDLVVQEQAEFVTPFDPALCDPPGPILPAQGLEAVVTVDPDWTAAKTQRPCLEVKEILDVSKDVQFEFQTPALPADVSGEQHSIAISIAQPGLPIASTTVPIRIEQGSPTTPPDDDNGGGGGNGGGGLSLSVLALGTFATVGAVAALSLRGD